MQAGRAREARKHLSDAMTLQGPMPRFALALALAGMPSYGWYRHAAGAAPRTQAVVSSLGRAQR